MAGSCESGNVSLSSTKYGDILGKQCKSYFFIIFYRGRSVVLIMTVLLHTKQSSNTTFRLCF